MIKFASVGGAEGSDGVPIPAPSGPDDDDWRRTRTAYHESGHAIAARAFGQAVGPVSIVPAPNHLGVCFHGGRKEEIRIGPVALWPTALKRTFEAAAIISLAGPAAADFFDAERLARRRPVDQEEAVHRVRQVLERHTGTLPRAERAKLQEAREEAYEERELSRDWENALRAIGILALEDAVALTPWIQHQARELVRGRWRDVEKVAAALLEVGTLSKKQLRELLAADRMRVPPGSTSARGYGSHHQRLRAELSALVTAGDAICARCGQPIAAGEPWDLDHTDDRRAYLGASHRRCNRQANRGRATLDLSDYRDDPARGVFWGPPDRFGVPRRWSRAWFDWRAEAGPRLKPQG